MGTEPMSLLRLFGKKSSGSPVSKYADRAVAKRAQAVDRWEAIDALVKMGTSEAIEALLPRFTFYVEPSITDQEEKDLAFAGIVRAGEQALAPVSQFLRKAESISWAVKMLDQIAAPEVVVEKLLALLEQMDVEYERDPQRKIQILATLEERLDPRIVGAVTRFLEDANETARFNAVGALFAQEQVGDARDALVTCLLAEESVRVRNRILQGFVERQWGFGERAEEVRQNLPPGYAIDAKGMPRASK